MLRCFNGRRGRNKNEVTKYVDSIAEDLRTGVRFSSPPLLIVERTKDATDTGERGRRCRLTVRLSFFEVKRPTDE